MADETYKERMAKPAARPQSGVISEATEFMALNSGRREFVQTVIEGEGNGLTGTGGVPAGSVVHNRAVGVTMYKPDGRGGFTPRTNIPATAISMNLSNGWRVHCPDCGGDHASMDPNECPAHDPIKTAFCPICNKQMWDNRVFGAAPTDHEDNPNVVSFEFTNSTPESRLRGTMEVHIWLKHPQQARILGLEPLAQAAETAMDISGV